jgi:hypothetical protein
MRQRVWLIVLASVGVCGCSRPSAQEVATEFANQLRAAGAWKDFEWHECDPRTDHYDLHCTFRGTKEYRCRLYTPARDTSKDLKPQVEVVNVTDKKTPALFKFTRSGIEAYGDQGDNARELAEQLVSVLEKSIGRKMHR